MRTPVYRHLDARGGIFGLSVLEWAPLLLVAWGGMVLDHPNAAALAATLGYGALRFAGQGRPEGHLQHVLLWRLRQARSHGRLSAAARASTPAFAFGDYAYRAPRSRAAVPNSSGSRP